MATSGLKRTLAVISLALLTIQSGLAQETLAALKNFEFGRSRRSWNSMEMQVRSPSSRDRRAAEQQLIEVLLAPDSTTDAKILACRGLRYVGTNSGVDALLSLVKDERLSEEACAALQEKDFKEINPVLREALTLAPNDLKPGLMNILARRRDHEAAPVIERIALGISDPRVYSAAVNALGQIGGIESLAALQRLPSKGSKLNDKRTHALLAAASHTLKQDGLSKETALKVLAGLMTSNQTPLIRGAAMIEIATAETDQRAELCLQALKSPEGSLLPAASPLLEMLTVSDFKELYGTHFDSLSSPAQILLVDLWQPAYREAKRIQDLSLNTSVDPKLRQAAIRAIDRSR